MNAVNANRKEVYDYFKTNLAPLIRKGASVDEVQKNANQIGLKYVSVVKEYEDSIRVSMNLKSNGIIYFMAETKEGGKDYNFKEPSFGWRE